MANNLSSIRARISKLQAERKRVVAAVPPASVSEQRLREHLSVLAVPSSEFIQNCADAINTGSMTSLTPATAPMLAQASFALALTATGIERVIESAKLQASAQDSGALRLDDAEKTERLAAIAADLYSLQLDEEATLDGAERRSDVNVAAALSIPLDIAVEFGLV